MSPAYETLFETRAFLNFQSQQSSVQRVIPSACGGGYGCFYAGYWTVISLALAGERGWREECDERVWGYLGSKRCVSVCWELTKDWQRWPRFVRWQSLCINRWRDVAPYRVHWTASCFLQWAGLALARTPACTRSQTLPAHFGWTGEKHTHTDLL